MSAGLLTFNSDLTLNPGSIIDIELGGTTPSLFDRISVDDMLTYGGTLRLSLIGDYNPQVGDSFQLFQDFNAQSGAFNSVVFTHPGVAGSFDYATGTLSLTAVPEPASGMLAGGALVGLLARRRRDCRE